MRRTVEKIMARYGTDVTIVSREETRAARGFFRAVNSKSWQNIESETTMLGEITRGQYVFLGPTGTSMTEGDTLCVGGRSYRIRRVEPYWYGREAVYQWALCVERGANDTWGTQS